jgi:poly(hydroxyalkanoate) depolymerase family esterase
MPVVTPRLRLRRSRKGLSAFAPRSATVDRLSDLGGLRTNPGQLRGRLYVPEGLEGPAPLVVVLHGCTQDAAVYDHGSGWSTLADRHGFILLYPEQQRANNPMLCFNWFSPADTKRGGGEAASIRAMIDAVGRNHEVDPARIFVTGLSAGGAMAAAILAAYPDVFAAGAIIAGVAYGCADGVSEAFDCMGGRGQADADSLAASVRRASPHKGPWPRVQVWQGSADHTVAPGNADALVRQWAALHGLSASTPDRTDEAAGHRRRTWTGADGAAAVEEYRIAGMAHGVPLASGGAEALGAAGAHMLDVGLSSTQLIAEFFGIAPEESHVPAKPASRAAAAAVEARREPPPAGPQAAIERALRAAGLMR